MTVKHLNWTAIFVAAMFAVGCGVNNQNKVAFSNVTVFPFRGLVLASFQDVYFKNINKSLWVYVDAEKIKVDIDSSLSGTCLTIRPDLSSRLFLPLADVVDAQDVIIWVQSVNEKGHWENWLKNRNQEIKDRLKYQEQPKKVFPF